MLLIHYISIEYSSQLSARLIYRSMDGTGMFNWRFVFPFDYMPQERVVVVSKKEKFWSLDKTTTKVPPALTIQVWDNDLIGANEYISKYFLGSD